MVDMTVKSVGIATLRRPRNTNQRDRGQSSAGQIHTSGSLAGRARNVRLEHSPMVSAIQRRHFRSSVTIYRVTGTDIDAGEFLPIDVKPQ